MSVPTTGEEYTKLMEHLRYAQESAAMLGHLAQANSERSRAMMWMAVSENLKKAQSLVTDIATRRMQ